MKKQLLTFLSLIFVASQASAKDNFYVGVDGLFSQTQNKIAGSSGDFGRDYSNAEVATIKKVGDRNFGWGANVGYKFDRKDFYISPEIFFEQLNNRFNYDKTDAQPYLQNFISLNYRYGARANLGYNFNQSLSGFLSYGFALVDYDVVWVQAGSVARKQYGDQAFSQVMGLGLVYNLNQDWAVKLAADYQKIDARYIYRGLNSRSRLYTTKLGLIYNF